MPKKLFFPLAVDRYHHMPDLRCPAADAERLARLFGTLGFDVEPPWLDADLGYDDHRQKDLFSRLKALRQAFIDAGGGTLVIYLAGHGASLADGTDVLFKPAAEWRDLDNARATSFIHVQRDLLAVIGDLDDVHLLVILNQCRRPDDHADGVRIGTLDPGGSRLARPLPPNTRVTLLYATQRGDVAVELQNVPGKGHASPFALAFEQVVMKCPRGMAPLWIGDLVTEIGVEMKAIARTLVSPDHPSYALALAQRPQLIGPDMALIGEEEAIARVREDADRRIIENARRFPDDRLVWLRADEQLQADSPFRDEAAQVLARLSETAEQGAADLTQSAQTLQAILRVLEQLPKAPLTQADPEADAQASADTDSRQPAATPLLDAAEMTKVRNFVKGAQKFVALLEGQRHGGSFRKRHQPEFLALKDGLGALVSCAERLEAGTLPSLRDLQIAMKGYKTAIAKAKQLFELDPLDLAPDGMPRSEFLDLCDQQFPALRDRLLGMLSDAERERLRRQVTEDFDLSASADDFLSEGYAILYSVPLGRETTSANLPAFRGHRFNSDELVEFAQQLDPRWCIARANRVIEGIEGFERDHPDSVLKGFLNIYRNAAVASKSIFQEIQAESGPEQVRGGPRQATRNLEIANRLGGALLHLAMLKKLDRTWRWWQQPDEHELKSVADAASAYLDAYPDGPGAAKARRNLAKAHAKLGGRPIQPPAAE